MPNFNIGAGGIGALAAIVAGVYVANKFGPVVEKVVDQAIDAVNPNSSGNLAYKGANAIGTAATGKSDFSLGAYLWEATHPGAVAMENKQAIVDSANRSFSDGVAGNRLFPEYYDPGYIPSNNIPGTFAGGLNSDLWFPS